MINWKKQKEVMYDLFLIVGLMMIVLGFINLREYSPWQIIISGIIITGIGTYGVLRKLKRKEEKIK
jgi:ABC-type nickel/cobalt efflux system permease component RcnA